MLSKTSYPQGKYSTKPLHVNCNYRESKPWEARNPLEITPQKCKSIEQQGMTFGIVTTKAQPLAIFEKEIPPQDSLVWRKERVYSSSILLFYSLDWEPKNRAENVRCEEKRVYGFELSRSMIFFLCRFNTGLRSFCSLFSYWRFLFLWGAHF